MGKRGIKKPALKWVRLGLFCSMTMSLAAVETAWAEVTWETGHQVHRLTQNEGLPSAYGLTVGPDGFLWLGTLGGLYRFDGRRLEAIPDAEGRPYGTINTLSFDTGADGDERILWLGTLDGLVILDLRRSTETRMAYDASDPQGLTHPRITDILLERDMAWVSTQHGLNRLSRDLRVTGRWGRDVEQLEAGRLLGRDVEQAFRDDQGRLFVATDYGLYLFRPEDESFELIPGADWQTLDPYRPGALSSRPDRFVNGVVQDGEGRILVGTFGGLLRLDEARRVLVPERTLAAACPAWEKGRVEWLTATPQGDVLVAGMPGVARLRGDHKPVCYGSMDFPGMQTEVLGDRAGNVWSIDSQAEVVWLPSGQDRPSRARPFENGRPGSVDRFIAGSGGELWSLMEGSLVHLRWTDELEVLKTFDLGRRLSKSGVAAPEIVTFVPGADEVWVSYVGGLAHLDAGSGALTRFDYGSTVPDGLQGRRLYAPEPGELWSVHVGEMDRCRLETGTCEVFGWAEPKDYWTLSFLKDSHGHLWAGAASGGFFRLDEVDRTWRRFRYEEDPRRDGSETRISSLVEDERGHLWLGTHHDGLLELDGEHRLMRRYDRFSVLGSDDARKVTLDDEGRLWIYASRGLTRLDPESGDAVRYDSAAGVPISGWARTIGVSGDVLLLSMGDQIFRFPTVGVAAEDAVPPVFFDRLRLGGVPVLPRPGDGRAHLQSPLRFSRSVTFGPEDRSISFELASPYFTKTRTQKLRYRLDDYDGDWIELSPESRVVSYTGLPAGKYRLRAQASNGDGRWGDGETVLAVTVRPPWWKSSWAFLAYVLAAGLALFGALRFQRLQLARKQEKLDHERLLNRRLREVDRLKDDFLANTSHELRTPLFGIAGLAEGLSLQKGLPERVKQDLSLIMSSARRLTVLVNDVLDFSKLQRSELSIDAQPVDVRAAVEGVLVLSKPLVGKKKLRLINDVERNLPRVKADEGRFDQILHNLIGNAVKFTQTGSVTVGAERVGGQIVVSVEDTGPGVAKEDRERIFRSFEQGRDPKTRGQGGTGLGLAVSFSLVEAQGGKLWLEPEATQGATFRFSLPIWAEAESPVESDGTGKSVGAAVDTLAEASGGETSEAPASAPEAVAARLGAGLDDLDAEPRRILLVDDEPINLRVLMSYLASPQFDLVTAPDGPTALALLAERPADLVVLDVMMPTLSGYEVCREIRKTWPLEALPVLLLTAKTGARDRVAGFESGANDYLIKPVERSELVARVNKELRLLDQHRSLTRKLDNLTGILPLCAGCKRVRREGGFWERIEDYLSRSSDSEISHGLCPDCVQDLYGDIAKG